MQWLSFEGPDPEGVQYNVMAAAVHTVIKKNGWDPKNTWVWVRCRANVLGPWMAWLVHF